MEVSGDADRSGFSGTQVANLTGKNMRENEKKKGAIPLGGSVFFLNFNYVENRMHLGNTQYLKRYSVAVLSYRPYAVIHENNHASTLFSCLTTFYLFIYFVFRSVFTIFVTRILQNI